MVATQQCAQQSFKADKKKCNLVAFQWSKLKCREFQHIFISFTFILSVCRFRRIRNRLTICQSLSLSFRFPYIFCYVLDKINPNFKYAGDLIRVSQAHCKNEQMFRSECKVSVMELSSDRLVVIGSEYFVKHQHWVFSSVQLERLQENEKEGEGEERSKWNSLPKLFLVGRAQNFTISLRYSLFEGICNNS